MLDRVAWQLAKCLRRFVVVEPPGPAMARRTPPQVAGGEAKFAALPDVTTGGEATFQALPEVTGGEVDFKALREVTGGDVEYERELIAMFIASGDESLADILDALQRCDVDAVGRYAHSLKGSSANMRADGLSETAGHLVTAAKSGNLTEVRSLVETLTVRLRAVGEQLRQASQ